MTETPPLHPLAEQLLDAQVRHHLDRLRGDRSAEALSALADRLLAAVADHQLEDLLDRDRLKLIVGRALTAVPGSAAVGGFVELATELVEQGPHEPFTLAEVVDREQVEALLDALFELNPLLERALERLTDSPLVATTAARFMGRIVGEVVQANQAVADRIPGLGSLVSFGTSATSKVVGAADKQLSGLLGDTVGKGGTLAVRRLNRILLETLRDPTTREALLQVWDLVAAEPVGGTAAYVEPQDLRGVVDAGHDLVVSTLADEHVVTLGHGVVDAFLDRFGGYTPTELLDQLDLDRADLVGDLVALAPGVLAALDASGHLERLVRAELEPFYASDEVAAILA